MSDETTQNTSEDSSASSGSTNSRDYIDWAGEVETTLRAMLGLPVQILTTVLPDETVQHLKAAGREGLLAAYSLWRNVDKSMNNQSGEKVRKRIEVE
ncbi:MAG TPA: hypothetical protein VLQ48_09465 [Chloroflexia bacterium]|nr:hypothetical protein [Chloroflexia bacterium]